MAVMEQNRFYGCHGAGSFLVSRGGKVFGVVVECSAGDVWGGRAEGFFGGLALDGGGVVPGRVPDVPGRVVVGRVRRRMDRRDALQQPAGPVEAGQGFRMVGAGVVRDDRDLAGLGFSLEQVQRADCLPGVPVLLGRVRRDCSAGRGEGVGEGLGRPLPVHGRSGALPFRGLHAAGPGLVLQAAGPGWSRVPASGRGRVPPRPGSPHARPGPGASWWPASRPATPAPSSPPARPSQR